MTRDNACAPRADDPDRDVLDLVERGDVTTALRRLMQRYSTVVRRYCRDALRDAILADDVHQQVFMEVFRDLPRFAGRAPVRLWLFAILMRTPNDFTEPRVSVVSAPAVARPVVMALTADPWAATLHASKRRFASWYMVYRG